MDKDLIGLIATWIIIILAVASTAIAKENKFLKIGMLLVVLGGGSYLMIHFWDIPFYVRYSTMEGDSGKHESLWFLGIGMLFLITGSTFTKDKSKSDNPE